MRTTSLDRLFLAACFWLMFKGLHLIRLGNQLSS